MSNGQDHLDDLFARWRAQPCRPVPIDVTLDDRIMQEFAKNRRKRGSRVGLVAGVVALGLLAGGVGVVAAGGLEVVQGWFGRVELVSPDGESKSFDVQGVEVFDDEGNAAGRITITGGEGQQSTAGSVTVERSQYE